MEKRLKIFAIIAICILVLSQFTALILFNADQIEDSERYRGWAITIAESNSFYPDETFEYEQYIANPGFINYLSLFYKISDNDKLPIAGNILLILIMAGCIYYIALKLFKNKTIAWLSLILLGLFPTFIGEALNLRSEILFTTIAYGAVAIVLSDNRRKYIFCGVLLALANWVRPLGLVFLLSIMLYMLITKEKLINYIKLLSSIIIVVLLIGTASYFSSGHFLFQSSTAGINFIMGANDDADGSYNRDVFNEGNEGYIENSDLISYSDKDEFWMDKSIKWIKENPGEYLALIPAKIYYMYAIDTYAFSSFYSNKVKTSGKEYITPLVKNIIQLKLNELTWVDFVVMINQSLYMAYLLLMVISVIMMLIKKQNLRQVVFLMSIVILGTGMTIVTVGGARYHYPYLPILFIMSAVLIQRFFLKNRTIPSPKLL